MEMIKILRLVMVRRFFSSLFSIWCFFCSVSVCFFHLFYIFFCSAALQSFRCSTLYALAFRTNQERFNQFCPSRNRKPHVSYASAIYRPLSPNLPFHFLLMDIRFCFFLSVCIFNLNSLSQALPVYFIYLFNIFFIHSNCIVDVCISVWVCMSMCLCEFSFARLIVFSFVSECYIFFSAASYCRLQLSWMSIYLRINACLNCERAWPLVRIHMFYGKRIVCDYFLRCVLSSRIYLLLYSCWTSKSIYTIYIAYPLDEAEGPRQKERERERAREWVFRFHFGTFPFVRFSLICPFFRSFVGWLILFVHLAVFVQLIQFGTDIKYTGPPCFAQKSVHLTM